MTYTSGNIDAQKLREINAHIRAGGYAYTRPDGARIIRLRSRVVRQESFNRSLRVNQALLLNSGKWQTLGARTVELV
jgi:hypothetical protein